MSLSIAYFQTLGARLLGRNNPLPPRYFASDLITDAVPIKGIPIHGRYLMAERLKDNGYSLKEIRFAPHWFHGGIGYRSQSEMIVANVTDAISCIQIYNAQLKAKKVHCDRAGEDAFISKPEFDGWRDLVRICEDSTVRGRPVSYIAAAKLCRQAIQAPSLEIKTDLVPRPALSLEPFWPYVQIPSGRGTFTFPPTLPNVSMPTLKAA